MATTLYELLKAHAGHTVEIAEYGDGANFALEDMDTDEVIFDTDAYDLVGKEKPMNKKIMTEDMYNRLCETLTDFENSTDNDTDPDWLSDGEWLDVFYQLCCDIQNNVDKTEI